MKLLGFTITRNRVGIVAVATIVASCAAYDKAADYYCGNDTLRGAVRSGLTGASDTTLGVVAPLGDKAIDVGKGVIDERCKERQSQ